jgi:hypothetical protein
MHAMIDVLRDRADLEVRELGPEPARRRARLEWRKERRAAVELLAALAGWDEHLLRRAALQPTPDGSKVAAFLLVDAAAACPDRAVPRLQTLRAWRRRLGRMITR